MDYPLSPTNILCQVINHWPRRYTGHDGIERTTCTLCGHTVPPFRKVAQAPPYDYLPDTDQPPGAR